MALEGLFKKKNKQKTEEEVVEQKADFLISRHLKEIIETYENVMNIIDKEDAEL